MPERDDLTLLVEAATEAGRIATRYNGKDAEKWEKPDGAGPVTEADLAVNRMLEQKLQAARPGYGWLSEESEDSVDRLSCRHAFVIDPIDGTRSFAEGSKTWAHSLAITTDGIPTAAVVYLPQRDLLYSAERGKGAFLNGRAISVSDTRDVESATILAARPAMAAHHWQTGTAPEFSRSYRPSLAYRLALVAEGRFDGMLTLRPTWEWDIAAGDLILTEAGAATSDRGGRALRFNNPRPLLDGVLAAGPGIHNQIMSALAPVTTVPAKPT